MPGSVKSDVLDIIQNGTNMQRAEGQLFDVF